MILQCNCEEIRFSQALLLLRAEQNKIHIRFILINIFGVSLHRNHGISPKF